MHRGLRIVAALLLVGGTIGGLVRVAALEGDEIDEVSEWTRLDAVELVDGRRTLGTVTLEQGRQVLFEVCSRDSFTGPWQDAAALELWHVGDGARLMRAELDAERLGRVRPEGAVGCLEVARADALGVSGTYALTIDVAGDSIPAALAERELVSRVRAMSALAPTDPWYRFAILLGALLLMVSFFVRPSPVRSDDAATSDVVGSPAREWGRALGGIGALIGAEIVLAFVPLVGSVMAFGRGLVLAGVELGASILLTPTDAADRLQAKLDALGLVRPRGGVASLLAAPFVGVALVYLGAFIAQLLPAVAQSHVASLVTFPSGLLAVVLIGAIAPAIEELFFRGFVYGRLERASGSALALLVTTLAFGLVHAPQVWGDPGALMSIFATGFVLTLLRTGTGSVVVPAVAHIAHNALTG